MSMIFGEDNSPRPPKRDTPQLQDTNHMQPWFVQENEPQANVNGKAKKIAKQTFSILFPIIGLTIIVLTFVGVIMFTIGLYE